MITLKLEFNDWEQFITGTINFRLDSDLAYKLFDDYNKSRVQKDLIFKIKNFQFPANEIISMELINDEYIR